VTLQTALLQGTDILERAGVPDARASAETLLCHALGRERVYLFSHPEHELSTVEWIHYGRYLHEREQGRPTQYVVKRQEFWGRPFFVTPAVLIPRPETELLIEHALLLRPTPRRILDLCTGSGCVGITLKLELQAEVVATDISPDALAVARANAESLGARVSFIHTDLAEGIEGPFDLITANPPYIDSTEIETLMREVRDHEPRLALDGGPGGLDLWRRIVPEAARLLSPGGWLLGEFGATQADAMLALFSPAWLPPRIHSDLASLPRAIAAQVGSHDEGPP
jgi:release factor glutamine methyltransferase